MSFTAPAGDVSDDPIVAGSTVPLVHRRRLPAWLMSLLLHSGLVILLGLILRSSPTGAAIEPSRAAGIVLASRTDQQVKYYTEADTEQTPDQSQQDTQNDTLANEDQVTVEPLDVLPPLDGLIGAGAPSSEHLPDAASFTKGRPAPKRIGGSVQTSIFGLSGTGTKFVYVFDRSGSMSDFDGRPLLAAKAELIASLRELDDIHQFQIIFYNERPFPFSPDGEIPHLHWADDRGKTLGERFVRQVVATGGTRHLKALEMAIRLAPDVIFFLTDAKEPQLTAVELDRIRRINGRFGVSIFAIEFGYGLDPGRDNFLRRLARQNGGRHQYVNISQWHTKR